MKIVLLLGSPNRQGSSRMLAESFRQGAEEAGHMVELIDAAHTISIPVLDVSAAAMRGLVPRKTMWMPFAARF